ncbi:MAG: HD-GYP domain-containing protein [Humidesulfovibrio sp.]
MHQWIKRSNLKPGMFIVSHGSGTFHSPRVRVGTHIRSLAQLEDLVPQGVEDVLIDTSTDLSLPTELPLGAGGGVDAPSSDMADELPFARKLYSEALEYVKRFVADVRKGTDIDQGKAATLVQSFIDSVFRNEAAAVTLFKLRGIDEYTYTHSINVSILAVLLGKHLGLDKPSLLKLGLAGLFHDLGKARIPLSLLNKPGKLNESEFQAVKEHPLEGYKILRRQQDVSPEVLRAVLEHHERHDGSGYPIGLKGAAIAGFSRIIAVVDVYDALTSKRVYKEAMPPAKALSMMFQWRGQQFAVDQIESFIHCIGVFPVGSFVRLSGGDFGIVAGANPARPTRPQIKVILDGAMRPRPPQLLDLETLEGTPAAQNIAEVLNPAEHKIDLERFFSA